MNHFWTGFLVAVLWLAAFLFGLLIGYVVGYVAGEDSLRRP